MSNKIKRESYRVKEKWVPRSEIKSIYPASDRSRNISNVNRVLGRCLEVNLGAEDVNFLYDTVGLCRVERKHALHGHKQVCLKFFNTFCVKFKIYFSPNFRIVIGMEKSAGSTMMIDEFPKVLAPIK